MFYKGNVLWLPLKTVKLKAPDRCSMDVVIRGSLQAELCCVENNLLVNCYILLQQSI